jgi:hypothetical protein
MSLVLHGFRYSVYVRIARIALAEKGLTSQGDTDLAEKLMAVENED